MDVQEPNGGSPGGFESGGEWPKEENKKKALPDDLPKSLDDRRHVPTELVPETEMYDGWQGMYPLVEQPLITGLLLLTLYQDSRNS